MDVLVGNQMTGRKQPSEAEKNKSAFMNKPASKKFSELYDEIEELKRIVADLTERLGALEPQETQEPTNINDPDNPQQPIDDNINDPDNTQQTIDDNINDPGNTTTVTTGDDQGNTNTDPLDPDSTVEPVTVDDGDDNPDNNPAVGTSDGEIIITDDGNNEP